VSQIAARYLQEITTDKEAKITDVWHPPCPYEERKGWMVMTVILVLVTFLVFIVLDYVLNRGKAVVTVPVTANRSVAAHVSGEMVDGFLVPDNLAYHPGHAWLTRERKGVIRVGADEFAASLVGKVERIELPKPGQWVRQGQKVLSFYRDGERTEMVSPTEGEVLEINAEVLNNPALLRQDPYGNGWLMTISVPDEENTSRNLIPKGLVGNWMRDAVERLYALQPALAGAVAPDGGRPTEDLLAGLPDVSWKKITGEFLLTARNL
jgi:glycine cleavage system H protein